MRLRFALSAIAVLTVSMVIADDKLDESKAIEKIELLGGKITRDPNLPERPVIGIDLQGNEGMKHLKRLNSLRSLRIECPQITEVSLNELSELPNLTELDLWKLPITDDGVRAIRLFKKLRLLNFVGTGMTRERMKEIQQALPNIDVPLYRQ